MRRRGYLVAGLALLSCVVAMAAAELLLRIWTPQALEYRRVRRADPEIHHALAPSAAYTHRGREFTVEVRTNSLGFRDRDHAGDPPDAFRIIVLGDSFVEGYGVPMESCFVPRLEYMLNEGDRRRKASIYNFGVAGYSPLLEYLAFKRKGVALRPDAVFLCYDMSDVSEDVLYAEDAEFDSAGIPLRVNPSWPSFGHVTLLPRGALKTFLREKSYLYAFLADALSVLKPKPRYEEGDVHAGQFMHTVDATEDRWQAHFEQSQKYVKLIADLCRSIDAMFVLVTYPRGNQVGPDEWREGRAYWGLDTLTHDSAIFGSLERFARVNSIPFLDMRPAFRSRSKGDLYLPFDGHWTSQGHAVAAETLYHFLGLAGIVPAE